jgi:hypothetical protein
MLTTDQRKALVKSLVLEVREDLRVVTAVEVVVALAAAIVTVNVVKCRCIKPPVLHAESHVKYHSDQTAQSQCFVVSVLERQSLTIVADLSAETAFQMTVLHAVENESSTHLVRIVDQVQISKLFKSR